MKAVVYNGPRDVAVTDVDDARIERPSDALVRITTTNICGSDLHMYEGRTDFEPGRMFGHENLGQVVEVGEAVERAAGRRLGLPALQHRVRQLRELRARADRTSASTAQPDGEHGRRRVRLRGHGPVPGRPGRVPARPVGRLQRLRLPRGRRGEAGRLRDARRHLPHRLARHRARGLQSGRVRGDLRRRPGRADGRLLRDDQGRLQGDGRRPPPRPPPAGRGDRRAADRRLQGEPRRARDGGDQRPRRATAAASASATRRTTRRATSIPTTR